MGTESRIEALETLRRKRRDSLRPLPWQHAAYDDEGRVIRCEQRVVPLNPPNVATLGPWRAGLAAMVRTPFKRETCPYDDCEKRPTCCADGQLIGQQSNS